MRLKKGDVLLAGPFRFIVEQVKGRFVQFSWHSKGIQKELWVCTNKQAPIITVSELENQFQNEALYIKNAA